MTEKEYTCIVCPVGCKVVVTIDENNNIAKIKGNQCPRGKDYVQQELIDPRRVLATTVRVKNGKLPLVPVKTDGAIPKRLLIDAMNVLANVEVDAPVRLGDIIVENILDTGVNVIATRTIDKYK